MCDRPLSVKNVTIILFLFLSFPVINSQILQDSSTLLLVKRCSEDIYNFDFSDARTKFSQISRSYPNHPVTSLLHGMLIYWENYPLLTNSQQRKDFEENMISCIQSCERKGAREDDPELLLANLCARGLLLLFYADNDLPGEVFPLAISTYKYVRRSFDYTESYGDFSFFTGLYNYYREAYPEAHPVYKPLTALFPKGEKKKGIRELRNAAGKAIVLGAESNAFLSYIYLSLENNFPEAIEYNRILHNRFPGNELYTGELIKNLLYVGRFEEAEHLILSDSTIIRSNYLKNQIFVFRGIIQEKKYRNFRSARELYLKGISELSAYGAFSDEIEAMACLGLGRIAVINGNPKEGNTWRKQGMNLTTFKSDPFADSVVNKK